MLVRWNTAFEIVIAITAPGSVLSGVVFLKTASGLVWWQGIAGCAAVFSFLKPFLKFAQRIKSYEQTLSGYRALEHDLHEVVLQVMHDEDYSAAARRMFGAAREKLKVLVTAPPEQSQNRTLVARLAEEVIAEFPKEKFYFPES